jgi:hypothetical protein
MSIKLKMRGCKLKSGVNWQEVVKQKEHKTNGHKTRPWLYHSSTTTYIYILIGLIAAPNLSGNM